MPLPREMFVDALALLEASLTTESRLFRPGGAEHGFLRPVEASWLEDFVAGRGPDCDWLAAVHGAVDDAADVARAASLAAPDPTESGWVDAEDALRQWADLLAQMTEATTAEWSRLLASGETAASELFKPEDVSLDEVWRLLAEVLTKVESLQESVGRPAQLIGKLVSVEVFAEMTDVTAKTIYRLCSESDPRERLPHHRIRGVIRINPEKALAWLEVGGDREVREPGNRSGHSPPPSKRERGSASPRRRKPGDDPGFIPGTGVRKP